MTDEIFSVAIPDSRIPVTIKVYIESATARTLNSLKEDFKIPSPETAVDALRMIAALYGPQVATNYDVIMGAYRAFSFTPPSADDIAAAMARFSHSGDSVNTAAMAMAEYQSLDPREFVSLKSAAKALTRGHVNSIDLEVRQGDGPWQHFLRVQKWTQAPGVVRIGPLKGPFVTGDWSDAGSAATAALYEQLDRLPIDTEMRVLATPATDGE